MRGPVPSEQALNRLRTIISECVRQNVRLWTDLGPGNRIGGPRIVVLVSLSSWDAKLVRVESDAHLQELRRSIATRVDQRLISHPPVSSPNDVHGMTDAIVRDLRNGVW